MYMILYVNNDYFNAGVPKRFTTMGQKSNLIEGVRLKVKVAFYILYI